MSSKVNSRYRIYEGETEREALNKLFEDAFLENRVENTIIIKKEKQQRKKFFGLIKKDFWVATAYIMDKNPQKGKQKSKDDYELFKELDNINDNKKIQKEEKIKKNTNELVKNYLINNTNLEQEYKVLKETIMEFKNAISSELLQLRENIIKNERINSLKSDANIINEMEITKENIKWIQEYMRERDFSNSLINDVVKYLNEQPTDKLKNRDSILQLTKDFIKSRITTESISLENYNYCKNILLAGTTGVGKTLTLVKMSVHLAAMRKKTFRFMSVDRYKIGADSQLKGFVDIVKVPFYPINSYEEFEKHIRNSKEAEFTFIDTAGRSPKETIAINELAEWVKKTKADFDIHLVVSANIKPRDMEMIAEKYSVLNYSHIIATKLDETNCYGSIISLAYKTGKPLSFITNGQEAHQNFEIADIDQLITDALK